MPTLVCFGDSLTAKEESLEGYERLTPRLRKQLTDWTIVNSGVSGETTRAALARLQDDVLRHSPELVTILFGSNDASEHRRINLQEYERNLEVMIDRINPKKTILISPPPIIEDSQDKRSNEDLARYAESARRIASKRGCYFIDLWTYFSKNRLYEKMLIEDGLHFNERAYLFFSELVYDQIKSIYAKAV
ncbi:SGNH/GDSL hydrolase family protein [Pseudalkalibacillus berkeleyi]|uniref:GDSL-type esterase/lipase family protein n=1 Tax=Pseudalkalibacillus berkeleyi TaxID=1069813 RepID=A0ABS9GZ48_9BACL|nr:GDSL-type esterase/lipase family protein [Pseudalkalibacillus berkeleyi]MCF6136807.1 GDSL-type esterase/lipase family protein [Pseudalkalibacillus berkeleyi]